MSGRALVSPSAGSQAPPSSTEASPRGPSASMPALPPVRPDIVIKGQGGFPDVVLKQGGRLHHSTSLPTLRMKKMVLVGPGAVVGQSARGGVGPGGDGPGPIVGQSLQSLHGGNGADGGGGPGGPSASSPSPPRRGRLSEADASRQAEVRLSSPEPRIVRRHGGRTVGRPHARPSALLPSLEPVRHRPAGPDEKEAALTQQEQQALRERRRLIREKARSWIDAAEAAEADAIGANLVMAGASGGDALGGAGGGQPGSTVDPMSKGVWGPLHRGAYLHVHLPTYLLPYFLTYLLTYLNEGLLHRGAQEALLGSIGRALAASAPLRVWLRGRSIKELGRLADAITMQWEHALRERQYAAQLGRRELGAFRELTPRRRAAAMETAREMEGDDEWGAGHARPAEDDDDPPTADGRYTVACAHAGHTGGGEGAGEGPPSTLISRISSWPGPLMMARGRPRRWRRSPTPQERNAHAHVHAQPHAHARPHAADADADADTAAARGAAGGAAGGASPGSHHSGPRSADLATLGPVAAAAGTPSSAAPGGGNSAGGGVAAAAATTSRPAYDHSAAKAAVAAAASILNSANSPRRKPTRPPFRLQLPEPHPKGTGKEEPASKGTRVHVPARAADAAGPAPAISASPAEAALPASAAAAVGDEGEPELSMPTVLKTASDVAATHHHHAASFAPTPQEW